MVKVGFLVETRTTSFHSLFWNRDITKTMMRNCSTVLCQLGSTEPKPENTNFSVAQHQTFEKIGLEFIYDIMGISFQQ